MAMEEGGGRGFMSDDRQAREGHIGMEVEEGGSSKHSPGGVFVAKGALS
jgi:hypothetical protein